jgi:hypothetical protein
MIQTSTRTSFPSQLVSNEEKRSEKYGLSVGKAIESEWFKRDSGLDRFYANRDNFHKLRLYARGEQDIRKYKDEIAINGDLSYVNLDWKPVPIIPKFVDIVVNGMSNRGYEIKAYSQDPASIKKRTDYMESVLRDMRAREYLEMIDQLFGLNAFNHDPESLPEDEDEFNIHMQLTYKQSIEIAEEEAINTILDKNRYELIKKRLDYDLTVIGMASVKHCFNKAEGITIEYVDPADLVYSYSDSPYFDDIYYVGEIKELTLADLKKQFVIGEDDLETISKMSNNASTRNSGTRHDNRFQDNDTVSVLFFEYKTFMDQVYKVKKTPTGGERVIRKDDSFNPPEESELFERVSRTIEVLYTGAKIVGHDKILKWELAENMTRPKANTQKVRMSYSIVAPRVYKGKIESLVSRMISFADMIQITHLKLQQVLARIVPDGVYLDADGLMEIDLGNGTSYNPAEALNMYFQTGSVIGRSTTADGEFNHGKIPIQELSTNGGNSKIQSLITAYNYYIQMIRDVTGLNEARDASTPDANALVGLQKLAAANSNTATRHILDASSFLTLEVAEGVSLRFSDVLEFSPTKESFIQSLGRFNVGTLEELSELHLHDFGIILELAPDEEQKQLLENNIQMALSRDQIYLEDAIDVREVKNIKLANQLLKVRRKKKMKQDQEAQQANIQAQSESNIQATQAAAMAEVQKKQQIAQIDMQVKQVEKEIDIEKLTAEAEKKKELMQFEFELNMQLEEMRLGVAKQKDVEKEDRKDHRTKIQATQQSAMIEQRKKDLPAKNFESAGFDNLGGFGLEQFEPR